MPNYCSNELKVSGSKEDLIKFDNHFKKDTTVFCYMEDRYGEMEETIKRLSKDIESFKIISKTDNNMIYSEKEEGYNFENFVPMPVEYAHDWYNWRCSNWGTKWNGIDICNYADVNVEEPYLDYVFDTAWCPPEPVILAMSKQFPTLNFSLMYEEEGVCFAGLYECENGCIKTDNYYENMVEVRAFMEENGKEFECQCPHCSCFIYEYEVFDCLEEEEVEEGKMICPNCQKMFELESNPEIEVAVEED